MSARFLASALLVAASAWAGPAVAQETGSRPTREFVQAAGQSDTFEIREAQTALAGTSDPQVRAYAQMMLRDHAATSRALQDAAAQARLEPPPMQVGDDQARMLNELQGLSGPDLDRAYWRHQALAHRSALTVEQAYAQGGDTPPVKRAAATAVPTIAAHLDQAERMRAAAGE